MENNRAPNILLIITDSQGPNVLGTSGAGFIKTPNIDGLARRGTSFTRAYNACPLCTPARAALFTGLSPQNAGAWSNDLPLGTTVQTMGEFFADIGYRTAYTGKWHLDGTDYFGTGVCPGGWDPNYWYDGRNYLADLSPEERRLWRSGLGTPKAIKDFGVTRAWTWAGNITDRVIAFMRNCEIDDKDHPWLAVASYDEPHGPSVCPEPYCSMYEDFVYPLPGNAGDDLCTKPEHHADWAKAFNIPSDGLRQSLYFGAGSFVDSEIGRLIDHANQSAPENTIIIYTSDHGHYLGAHGLDGKGPAMYEEVVRIPLIVAGPGVVAGRTSDGLISHEDVLPTLLSLGGGNTPAILEGVNQADLLSGKAEESTRDYSFTGFSRFSVTHDSWGGFFPIRTVVSREYKMTINLHTTDELYDLNNDPLELNNLINSAEYTEVAASLHSALLDHMDTIRDPFRGPQWCDRPWSRLAVPPRFGGFRRPRPSDGTSPVTYNYDTGMPANNAADD